MVARSQIASLDSNADVGREPAKQNVPRYKQQFSKVTQSWEIKKIAAKKELICLDHLQRETITSNRKVVALSRLYFVFPCQKNLISRSVKYTVRRFAT